MSRRIRMGTRVMLPLQLGRRTAAVLGREGGIGRKTAARLRATVLRTHNPITITTPTIRTSTRTSTYIPGNGIHIRIRSIILTSSTIPDPHFPLHASDKDQER